MLEAADFCSCWQAALLTTFGVLVKCGWRSDRKTHMLALVVVQHQLQDFSRKSLRRCSNEFSVGCCLSVTCSSLWRGGNWEGGGFAHPLAGMGATCKQSSWLTSAWRTHTSQAFRKARLPSMPIFLWHYLHPELSLCCLKIEMTYRYFLEAQNRRPCPEVWSERKPFWKDSRNQEQYIQSQHSHNLQVGGLCVVHPILYVAKNQKGKKLLHQLTLECSSEFSLIPRCDQDSKMFMVWGNY